jgi:arabinogalactan oligomer/maltooligosaccharide transport system substrate-binding protein
MKLRDKRGIAAAVALVAVAAVTAASVAVAGTSSKKATTITFWQTYNTQETETLTGLIGKFEAAHPDINVKVSYVDFSSHDQKFTTAAQAGQAPDIMRADVAPDTASWAAQGLLADLTSLVSAKDKADYVKAALSGATYQGKIWALPHSVDALALFYSKKLFASKGIKHPPATLAELVTDCQKFGAGKGIALRGDSYWIQPWIWGYGGGLVSVTKKEIYIASSKSIAGWAAYNSLFHNKCAFPDKDFSNDYGNAMTAFKNGQVAMIVNGPWSSSDVLSGPAFKSSSNFQVAVLPRGPGGQGSPVGGGGFVISRNSQHVKEAYTFMSWLTAPAQEAVFAEKNNLLPSRVSAYAIPSVKKNRIIVQFLAQMKVSTDRSAGPQGSQLYTDFTPNMQKMLNGSATPSAAANAVANAWKSKLFQGYKIVK